MTIIKNLLLIDYQLDNIHNINQVKLPQVELSIIIDNLNNDILKNNYEKIGLLLSDNILFNKDNFLQDLQISFPNSFIEFINDTNYFNYLDIVFDYDNTDFIIDYNHIDPYLISLKKLSIYGGIFYLELISSQINCFINNENGNINITSIKLGIFQITINYKIFNFNINKILNITIKPIIKYQESYDLICNILYISDIPEIIPNNLNGKFYLDETCEIFSLDSLKNSLIIYNYL